MERISSLFFMVALMLYYIPKGLKIRKFNYVKTHIITGSMSIIAMVIALLGKIRQADFVKYIGFTIIMISIGVTGYLIKRNPRLYRKLHVVFTMSFFVYLFISIKFF